MKHIILYALMALLTIYSASALSVSAMYPDMDTHTTIDLGQSQEYFVIASLDIPRLSATATANFYDISGSSEQHEYLGVLWTQDVHDTIWMPPAFTIIPSHYQELPGEYLLDVRVDEVLNNGAILTRSAQLHLTVTGNRAPIADFTWSPEQPLAGEQVSFDASSSYDIDGHITMWAWDVNNDGTTDFSGEQITHTFTEQGTYQVKLTVTDNEGASAQITQTIQVGAAANSPPVMQPIPDHTHPENRQYEYQLIVSDPDDDVLTCFDATILDLDPDKYLPDWLTLDEESCLIYGTTPHVNNNLSFIIMVGVTDGELTDIQNYTLTVLNIPGAPTADFVWSPTAPLMNEPVTFTSTSSDEQGIESYHWTFPTGTSTGPIVTWPFSESGPQEVSLRIVNINGLEDTMIKTVHVVNPLSLNVQASANPSQGVAPLTVQYECAATGGNAPFTYTWVFSDHNVSGSHITKTFTEPEEYESYCHVQDASGETATSDAVTVAVYEHNAPPLMQPIEGHTHPENTYYEYQLEVSDSDDDVLTCYEVLPLPSWLHLNTQSCVLNGTTPDVEQDEVVLIHVGVTDGELDDTQYFYLTIVAEQEQTLDIDEFGCNPNVVQGHIQRCSVHVSDQNGMSMQGALVTIMYEEPEGLFFGECTTNFKGYCSVDATVDLEPANYTVTSQASLEGYVGATSNPFTFEVLAQRYDIVDLTVYGHPDNITPQDTFYRGEAVYAQFSVVDSYSGEEVCDDSLVRSVFLRVNNAEPLEFLELTKNSRITLINKITNKLGVASCVYSYYLPAIPLSDDYLGGGRVFAFVFNFSDNTAGQDSVLITVLNNPVVMSLDENFTLYKSSENSTGQLTIDFTAFVSDVETEPQDMLYELFLAPDISSEDLWFTDQGQGVFTIHAGSGFVQTTQFTLRVDDTDGSVEQQSATLNIIVTDQSLAPVAIAGADQTVYVNDLVYLNANQSYDPGEGHIVLYEWDFGNGQTSSSTTPLALTTYYSVGTYNVTLIVTDNDGLTGTDTLTVRVVEQSEPTEPEEELIPQDGVRILSISAFTDLGSERALSGDVLYVRVSVQNNIDERIEYLRVTYTVPELGIKQKSSQFSLGPEEQTTRTFAVYIPYDAYPGEYYTQIGVGNSGEVRRSVHRMLEIVE